MPRVKLNQDAAERKRRDILYGRYGGFMSIANLMSELGVSRNTAVKFADGLPFYTPTGRRLYAVEDVARKIEGSRG